MQQRPQDIVIQQGTDSYEQVVNATAFTAKAYWAMWGARGANRW